MTSKTTSRGSRSTSAPGVPVALSSFVGRVTEIAELPGLLERARLVTLTGAPGIGKTRVALEVARRVSEDYRDRAWLVDLARIDDPALLPRALADSLSVQEAPGVGLTDSVLAYLAKRRVLLVVDNCEHLIDPSAQLVEVLLSGCPGLSILATSREPLALAGEHVWCVPTLSVPAASEPAPPESLLGYDAVRLFVDRAGAARAGFVLDVGDAVAVAEIVRRLDGIPLAIELAAARVDMLTPAQIAQRLENRFGLLSNGSRSRLPRQQALSAAIDWSHDLLSVSERILLRRLAVFAGGFSLDGCEAVCAAGELDGEDAFRLLARLVAKSLVVADTATGPTARYRLLETMRAYASDRLEESGEAALVGETHARAYLELAERAEPELTGPSQELWTVRLDAERANLRAALEWSLAHDHADWALRVASALVLFWRLRCYFGEGRDLIQAALRSGDGEPPALRAKALWGAGYMTHMAGDLAGARPELEQSLTLFRELGDAGGCARALLILGNAAGMRGDPSALPQLEQSATLAREAGDLWCLAHALAVAGYTHNSLSDLRAARRMFEQSLAAAGDAQDSHGRQFALLGLGDVALIQGDYPVAATVLDEALVLARELGEDYTHASALLGLGELACCRGDYDEARTLLEDSLACLPEPAPAGAVISSLMYLADVAHADGDLSRARRLFDDAVERALPWGTPAYALQGLGKLAADEGDLDKASGLFEAALELARAKRNHRLEARVLHELGLLARDAGDTSRAAAMLDEALSLRRASEEAPAVAASLEAIGGLAAARERYEHGARLLAAANAIRERNGYARTPRETARYQADVRLVQEGLSAEAFASALTQGAGLSIKEAVTLAFKGRRRQVRPSSGWPSLTETEKQVAGLVAEGFTNPQIADRMFMPFGTVKSHLRHIFSKLGISTRRELEREVRRHQMPTPGDSESQA